MAQIDKISEKTKNAIFDKSAANLPHNPSASGMKPEDILKRFILPITDEKNSVIAEIDRVIDDVNIALEELSSGQGTSGGGSSGGGASVVVAQTTGSSKTAVMSQKATTDKLTELQANIDTEAEARESSDNAIKGKAIGVPTYNASTGVMTFKTLDNGTTRTYDLPIEKILKNVELSADGKSFVFTFHNSGSLTVPLGHITLPAWVTDVANATGEQLLIPPNTEAVRNYIITKINTETAARASADDAIKAAAVGKLTRSGQVLIFKNLNGAEIGSVTLPSGSTGTSSGSCDCIPYRKSVCEYYGNESGYATVTIDARKGEYGAIVICHPKVDECGYSYDTYLRIMHGWFAGAGEDPEEVGEWVTDFSGYTCYISGEWKGTEANTYILKDGYQGIVVKAPTTSDTTVVYDIQIDTWEGKISINISDLVKKQ